MSFSCLHICIKDQVLPAGDNRCFNIHIAGIPADADVEENLINVLSKGFLICSHYEKSMS
jgi:hypothetical protein